MRLCHELKIAPEFYREIVARKKTAEIRLNDRGYSVGDIVVLRPFDEVILGEGVVREITHILHHHEFPGLAPGYAMLCFGDAP